MRVLVAGCGYVGTALGRRLVDDGHEVVATRRDPADLPDTFTRVATDLTVRADVDELPDVDAVAVTVSSDERSAAAYRRAYVDTIATLRASYTARATAPTRWLFTSSTAVYGDTGGDWVDEDTPTEPSSDTGAVLVEAEHELGTLPGSVAVRLGGIYGPGRTRLLERVRAGEATCPPSPVFTNRIHRDDIARLCHQLLVADDVPAVVNGVDDDPAERCEVLRWLAEALGAPPPRTSDGGRTRSNKRVRNTRLHDLGVELGYPTFRDGYAEMIASSTSDSGSDE